MQTLDGLYAQVNRNSKMINHLSVADTSVNLSVKIVFKGATIRPSRFLEAVLTSISLKNAIQSLFSSRQKQIFQLSFIL